jgi:hypothetical protein
MAKPALRSITCPTVSVADARVAHDVERIVLVDRESSRYVGSDGQAEFLATAAMRGGEIVRRSGRVVEAVDIATIRWVGDRSGELITDEDRARIVEAIRNHFRSEGSPYQLRHSSGELEDETGRRSPGFRSALPHAAHSDGWSLSDVWMSPEFPDPTSFPPMVVYRDASCVAELPRRIEVRGDRRLRVLVPRQLRWCGDRDGQPMAEPDRARIVERIRSVYDEWGYRYVLEDD